MPWLINAAQLDKFRKSQKNVIVLDASWHLPTESRNARSEYNARHIAGARFLDLDQFSDKHSTLSNMLIRDENDISEKIRALGITNDHKIIFYDNSSLHSSCRALWMFKVFGHNPNQLYILDGGYPAWEEFAGKVEEGESRHAASKSYAVNFEAQYIRTLAQIKMNQSHPQEQLVDLRHPVRYVGGKEHRPNVRSGHIPGSFCFPYSTIFDLKGHFKPVDKIRKQLIGIGVEFSYPIVTLCGSGMTAAILNFVLDLLNHPQQALYDGSWTEWGSSELFPGESDLSERPVKTCLDT